MVVRGADEKLRLDLIFAKENSEPADRRSLMA